MAECIICRSEWREMIEGRLAQGEPAASVSKVLRDLGAVISAGTINHHAGHMGQASAPPPLVRSLATPSGQGEEAPAARLDIAEPRSRAGRGMAELVRDTLEQLDELTRSQLAIVAEGQRAYAAGERGHPDAEMKGLKLLQGILGNLRAYQDGELSLPVERRVTLPRITCAEDVTTALSAISDAALSGRLRRHEAVLLVSVVAEQRKALETARREALEQRLRQLEQALGLPGPLPAMLDISPHD